MEPDKQISTEISQKNTDPILFYANNGSFILAYKKTEKLASAVYMITGLLFDSEPMKWTLRKKINDLLFLILTFKDVREGGFVGFSDNVKTKIIELISLLEISLRGGLVSQMNFSILKQEFLNLLGLVDTASPSSKESAGEGIAKDFFELSKNYQEIAKRENDSEKRYKIPESAATIQRMSLNDVKDKALNESKENIKKTNRQSIIINLLKKKKELSIKDISSVIKDCSEKTIQRELNAFISSGLLKRVGVRRWSRYSLA